MEGCVRANYCTLERDHKGRCTRIPPSLQGRVPEPTEEDLYAQAVVHIGRLQARATVYAALAALPRTPEQGRDADSIVRDAVAIVAKLETAS